MAVGDPPPAPRPAAWGQGPMAALPPCLLPWPRGSIVCATSSSRQSGPASHDIDGALDALFTTRARDPGCAL